MTTPSQVESDTDISYCNDDERWQAVSRRDPRADGRFFFAVKTTGVYCRPSCPSRAARRENVVFHLTRAGAERAGFRACKRCQPDGPGLPGQHAKTVARACRIIEAEEKPPTLETLARSVGMSAFHFHRVFTKTVGVTPKAYATARRAGNARRELQRQGSVTEAIYAAGYNSGSRFYEGATHMLGMQPQAFHRGGVNETIRFAVGECSLGSILVASSEKGLCAVLLGKDPNELARQLQDCFPKARLIGGEAGYEQTVAEVIALVEEPRHGLRLPLDIRGTAFQQRVWQALGEIPPGETMNYAGIAAHLGQPKSVRAVANACAANKLAVAIPCHRVVRTDGSLSGYRWGVERKQALLEKEKSTSH